jgi:hypothetical protein
MNRWSIRRTVVAVVGTAGLLLAAMPPANADRPIDSHNGGVITIQCTKLGPLDVGFTTAGEWVHAAEPRLVVNSTLVLVAYGFHYVFTPTDGSAPIVVEGYKPAPKNRRLDTCVMTINDIEEPAGVFVATYWVSYTPR